MTQFGPIKVLLLAIVLTIVVIYVSRKAIGTPKVLASARNQQVFDDVALEGQDLLEDKEDYLEENSMQWFTYSKEKREMPMEKLIETATETCNFSESYKWKASRERRALGLR
jgi:hypothetical protein